MPNAIDILIRARDTSAAALKGAAQNLIGVSNAAQSASTSATGALQKIDQGANVLIGGLSGVAAAATGLAGVTALLSSIGSEMAELGARGAVVNQLADVFEDYARAVGSSADDILSAMKKASQGTIAESELILNANRAIQFQVAQTPKALAQLVELSSALGRAQGITDTQALEFLTTGIARESRLILDNLGLIVDLEQATKAYAETLGKSASELTEVERKQAILNEAYRQGEIALRANRDAADSPATRVERFEAAKQDFKEKAGEAVALATTDAIEDVTLDLRELTDVAFKGGQQLDTIQAILEDLRKERDRLSAGKPVTLLGINLSEEVGELGRINTLIASYNKLLLEAAQKRNQFKLNNPEDFGIQQGRTVQKNPLLSALEGAPEIIDDVVTEIRKLDSVPFNTLVGNLEDVKANFKDIEKSFDAGVSSITSNAVKAAPDIGVGAAFDLANQQIEEFRERFEKLSTLRLSGEISTPEFLFQLQTLPQQVNDIFSQVSQAQRDGGQKLADELSTLLDLRDAVQINVGVNADTAALDALNSKISEIESVLSIVNPTALNAAKGLNDVGAAASGTVGFVNALVGAYSDSASAAGGFASETSAAGAEVNALVGALGSAPAALAALASGAIAAGANLSVVSAQVADLRAEFVALEGAQSAVRRSIINRAASVSDIVGDTRALSIAQEQIAGLDTTIDGLGQQLFDGTITAEAYEYQLAKLDQSFTGVFDDIETADRKSKSLAKTVGSDLNQAFSNLQSKVSSVLSGALNVDVGVNTDSLLPREDAINEDARRLADVAVRGWDSPWASYLSQKFPDLVGKAFDSGGDVKQTAARLLRDFEDGLVPQLIDKDTAKERVRRALIGDQNMAALAKEIATELSAEFGGQFSVGQIRATAGVALGVDGAETEQLTSALTSATTGVQEKLSGLGTSLKTGIVSALDGIGEAVTNAISKQLSAENNLKQIQQSGYDNGIVWGNGFLESMDELTSQVLEKLAGLVAPYVEDRTRQTATLQGAN